MAYTSVLLTAGKEPYGGLLILIHQFLHLKGVYSKEEYSHTWELSFSEWLSEINELEANNKVKRALCEILYKTAQYQVENGMNQYNVLAAFSDFDGIAIIKQNVTNIKLTKEKITKHTQQISWHTQQASLYTQQVSALKQELKLLQLLQLPIPTLEPTQRHQAPQTPSQKRKATGGDAFFRNPQQNKKPLGTIYLILTLCP